MRTPCPAGEGTHHKGEKPVWAFLASSSFSQSPNPTPRCSLEALWGGRVCSPRGPCLRPGSWGGSCPETWESGHSTRFVRVSGMGGGQRWRCGAGHPSESGGPTSPSQSRTHQEPPRVSSHRASPQQPLSVRTGKCSGYRSGCRASLLQGARASIFLKVPHLQSQCLLPGGWAHTGLEGAAGRREGC